MTDDPETGGIPQGTRSTCCDVVNGAGPGQANDLRFQLRMVKAGKRIALASAVTQQEQWAVWARWRTGGRVAARYEEVQGRKLSEMYAFRAASQPGQIMGMSVRD